MGKKIQPDHVKHFMWLLLYQVILRLLVSIVSLLPFCLVMAQDTLPVITEVISLILSISLIPFLVVIQTAILLRLFRKPRSGKFPIFSTDYYLWLRRNIVAEYVSSSSLLNNLVHRTSVLKILYYGMLGYRKPSYLIIAPDVKILDPGRCQFEKFVFIGVGTVIGGHTIKSLQLLLADTKIGSNVNIGSFCKFAVGVEIGKGTFIDYGVEVGMLCKIGDNVTIFAGVKLDDETVIEDNAVIGKAVTIGRKSHIGRGSFIGAYSRLGSRTTLPANSKISEMTDVKREQRGYNTL